jgi:hypothetical protein
MTSSLEAMLALIEADVPERLISPHTFAALRSICRLLPVYFSSGIGFESRLAKKSAEVDLILRVPVPRGLEILRGNDRSCRLPDFFFEDGSWQRLRALALGWETKPKEWREAVLDVWIEFDADRFANPVPSPGLLLFQIDKSDSSREDWHQILRAAYAIVRNRPVHSELAKALETCLERLPHHAHVLYAGMGMSRPTDAVRLVLGGLSLSEILGYLGSTGWAGDLRDLEVLLLDVGRSIDQFYLNIDILASVCPKIGIECHFGREEDSLAARSWRDFLDFVTGKGWCLPEKSAGLLQWPGRNLFQAGIDSWPWTVERFLNHMKLTYDPASGVEAKAYFGLVWGRARESLAE